jgi:hypothetical protein
LRIFAARGIIAAEQRRIKIDPGIKENDLKEKDLKFVRQRLFSRNDHGSRASLREASTDINQRIEVQ